MTQNDYTKTRSALIKAVTMLCRPLIRLLIEKGLTFVQFRELMKELYVEVADEYFSLDGKNPSDSRIFVLTGVHRKDIKRLRQQAGEESKNSVSSASLSGEIVARWISMPQYLDANSKPKRLLKVAKNNEAGFDQLVSSVSKDVRPKVILDEWLRLDMVYLDEDYVVLNRSAFVTNKEFNEMAYYLGHNVHDHIASCVNNIMAEEQPMLERSVYYSSLTENSVKELNAIARNKGDELLQTINSQAIRFYDADKDKDEIKYRMRLGVYWFQTQLESKAGSVTNSESSKGVDQ